MSQHAWLQKHPSPVASGGEFHWVPAAGDRELRASFVERVRGLEPPAVLWQLEPGRVAWGQVFSAIAPTDGRRYVGLVLSVVEGDGSAADLLASLRPPPAAPWTGEAIRELVVTRPLCGELTAVARALISGGTAAVGDPARADLPQWIAALERVLPEHEATRRGVWTSGEDRSSVSDRVAELAVAASRGPASQAARAWTLLRELAVARGESIDQVGRAVQAIDQRDVLTADERAGAGDTPGLAGLLHAWGRGRLDRSASATLVTRLADLVALRVLEQLAGERDANAVIAEVRWTALLPAHRRTLLLDAIAERTGSLCELVEAHHA